MQYNYSMMKCNVELHPALCITFAVADANGKRPFGVSAWKFNFHFDPHKGFYDEDFLQKVFTPTQLARHREQGIYPYLFGEEALGTSLVLTEESQYILFSSENQINQSSRLWRSSGSPYVDCRERRMTSAPSGKRPGVIPGAPGAPREIMVPAEVVSGLIGRGGSIIKSIRQRAGGQCRISLLQPEVPGGPQVCRITGPEELLQRAEELVQIRLNELLTTRGIRPAGGAWAPAYPQ
ncbi:CNOT7, partial [Symbiodinium natans]